MFSLNLLLKKNSHSAFYDFARHISYNKNDEHGKFLLTICFNNYLKHLHYSTSAVLFAPRVFKINLYFHCHKVQVPISLGVQVQGIEARPQWC